MTRAFISGIGYHVPDRVVTNDDLAALMDTSDEWIRERTGIQTRRFVDEGVSTTELSIPAVERALGAASLTVNDIDLIIYATSTPDYMAPGSGCLLQDRMGFPEIGALDVRVQCSGFIYGLSIADQYIRTGDCKHVLVVGAEVQSTGMDLSDAGRDVSVIFGDGAGAAVVSATEEDRGILSTHLHSEGKYAQELWSEVPASARNPRISLDDIKEGRHWLKMNGREVFRHAVTRFPEAIMEAIQANNMKIDDVSLVIPHQANLRITLEVARRLRVPPEKVYSNIERFGNTTAASIPIAMAEVVNANGLKQGDYLVLVAFGSGFAWASAMIKW